MNSSVWGNCAYHPNQNARFAGSRASGGPGVVHRHELVLGDPPHPTVRVGHPEIVEPSFEPLLRSVRYTRLAPSRTRDDHERVTGRLSLEHRMLLEKID